MFVLGEWCIARALIQLCQGVRPISSTEGPDSQCFNYLLHGGSPGLVGVNPYQGYAIVSILSGISDADQQVGNIMAGFLNVPPDFKAAYRKQFHWKMARELKVIKVGADVKISPQGDHILLPSLCFVHKESTLCHHIFSLKMQGIDC